MFLYFNYFCISIIFLYLNYSVPYNWWKDVILVAVLMSCAVFAGLAWRERKTSQGKVDKLMALMKIAENELLELQQKM